METVSTEGFEIRFPVTGIAGDVGGGMVFPGGGTDGDVGGGATLPSEREKLSVVSVPILLMI